MSKPVGNLDFATSRRICWSSPRTWLTLGFVAMILALLLSISDIVAVILMKQINISPETIHPRWIYTTIIVFCYIILWQGFGFLWRKSVGSQTKVSISDSLGPLGPLGRKKSALSWIFPGITMLISVFLVGHARIALGIELERITFVLVPFLSFFSAKHFCDNLEPLLFRHE